MPRTAGLETTVVEEQKDGVLLVERPEEHIVVLTLNYPERLNALTAELRDRLTEIWPEIDADPSVRVIVFTGAGRGFCSGADMANRPGADTDLSAAHRRRELPGPPDGPPGMTSPGQ